MHDAPARLCRDATPVDVAVTGPIVDPVGEAVRFHTQLHEGHRLYVTRMPFLADAPLAACCEDCDWTMLHPRLDEAFRAASGAE